MISFSISKADIMLKWNKDNKPPKRMDWHPARGMVLPLKNVRPKTRVRSSENTKKKAKTILGKVTAITAKNNTSPIPKYRLKTSSILLFFIYKYAVTIKIENETYEKLTRIFLPEFRYCSCAYAPAAIPAIGNKNQYTMRSLKS